MQSEINDKELILLIKNNPSLGMSKALDLYGSAIKTIVKSILLGFSNEDIEETISDSFTALWRSIDNFNINKQTSIKSYLYGISRRTALNKKRVLSKEKCNIDIDKINSESDKNVEEEVCRKIDMEIIKDLIKSMKNPDKQIFIYRYFFQKKVKEISQDLNLKPKKVENILARGKEKLKKQLVERSIM